MKYNKVVIKQIPDANAVAFGLDKYKRSKIPRCADVFQVSILADGRFITGLDEEAQSIQGIENDVEREEKINELKTLKATLEKLLRVDLSSTSTYWETFAIKIDSDNDLVLNKSNPLHVIMYHALIANGYVAPSFEESSEPIYLNSKYYCHVDEIVLQEKNSSKKIKDKARAELYKIAENKDKLLLYGRYLEGAKYKSNMSPDTLYNMLSDFIDDVKRPENIDTFLRAVKLSVEELQYKITVETAIRKKIIKFKEGQYYRGGVNLGRSAVDVLSNLKQPEYASEFVQIHEEVNAA